MKRIRFHTLILAGYTLLTLILTYPLVGSLTTHVPFNPYLSEAANLSPRALAGGVGDHWVYLWALGFFGKLLPDSGNWSLVTDLVFYPRGVDLTYPTLFGFGIPILASIPLVRVLGVIATYNVLIVGSFIAAAYATFLLARDLLGDWKSAFISGVIFAFAPYHMARALGHLNLLASAVWIPLFALFFLKGMTSGRVRHLLGASACFGLTVVSNPYYTLFLGAFAFVYVLYRLGMGGTEPGRGRLLWRAGMVVGLGPAPVFLLVAWMLRTVDWRDVHALGPAPESFIWGADLLAFVVPSLYHPVWGPVVKGTYERFASNATEQSVFVGWVVLALAGVGALTRRREPRFWSVCALVFFVLSLGPFLHVGGRDTFSVGGVTVAVPLPSAGLAMIPGVKNVRVASRWFVLVLLAVAVLAGYGARALVRPGARGSTRAGLWAAALVGAIAFEFVCAPLPLVDASIPPVYAHMGTDLGPRGTVLDVPLDWRVFKYEYYQTAHRQRVLLGQAPRLSLSLVTTYADGVPFVRLFKDPRRIGEDEPTTCNREQGRRFTEFFDLRVIVLHRPYLVPEVLERVKHFLLRCFPVGAVQEAGDLVAVSLIRREGRPALLMGPDGYRIDFEPAQTGFFLVEGWWPPERWTGLSAAWSDAGPSRVWVYVPQPVDLTMDVRVLPLTFPGSPRQEMKIAVNDRLVTDIQLDPDGWKTYVVDVSGRHLRPGFNRIGFAYGYAAAPADVIPGSHDRRTLAVAFQFIHIRPRGTAARSP